MHAPTHSSATTPRRAWLALAALVATVMMVASDNTTLQLATPALAESLAPTAAQLLWIIDVYAFVLASLLLTMGAVGDRVGRRRLLLVGTAGFAVLSVVAAYAPTAPLLIAARAGMGVFGAMLMPSTLSLLRGLFPDPRSRTVAIAVWSAAFSVSTALGPLLGGWLLEHFWYGSIFLVNLAPAAATLVLVPVLVPESTARTPGRVDLLSAATSLAAVLGLVGAVKTTATGGPVVLIAASALLGVLSGWVFVGRQRGHHDPLLDLGLLRIRPLAASVVTNLLLMFALVGSLLFLAQHLQLVLRLGAMQAALVLLPASALAVIASFVAVPARRHVPLHRALGGGVAVTALGFVVLSVLGLVSTTGALVTIVAALVLIGGGVGFSDTLTNDAILASVPADRAGAAAGLSETAYELGAALGTAVLGSVLAVVYRSRLAAASAIDGDLVARASETLAAGVAEAERLGGTAGAAAREAIESAFTSGVAVTSVVAAVLLAIAAAGVTRALRETSPLTRGA